jgi:hypothetical protein
MAGGALEVGGEFVERPGHGAASQDFEFGGVKVGERRHDKHQSEYRGGRGEQRFFHEFS